MSRRIYFLRHGKADRTAWDGADDRRPLTDEGREALERSAAGLQRLDLGVDLVLSSPLVRAVQTADIVADILGCAGGVVVDRRLGPSFGPGDLAALLAEHHEGRLLLVGHEPSFSAVVGMVTGGSRLTFRKGGLARVDLVRERPPRGSLEWLLPPRALGA